MENSKSKESSVHIFIKLLANLKAEAVSSTSWAQSTVSTSQNTDVHSKESANTFCKLET